MYVHIRSLLYSIVVVDIETRCSAFEENTITTGWLDTLISNKLTAERPETNLAVVCGAVTKAHIASEACWAEYRRILDKGQVPSKDVLKTVFGIDFIYEGSYLNPNRIANSTEVLYMSSIELSSPISNPDEMR